MSLCSLHSNLMIWVYSWDAQVTISQQNCHCTLLQRGGQKSKFQKWVFGCCGGSMAAAVLLRNSYLCDSGIHSNLQIWVQATEWYNSLLYSITVACSMSWPWLSTHFLIFLCFQTSWDLFDLSQIRVYRNHWNLPPCKGAPDFTEVTSGIWNDECLKSVSSFLLTKSAIFPLFHTIIP